MPKRYKKLRRLKTLTPDTVADLIEPIEALDFDDFEPEIESEPVQKGQTQGFNATDFSNLCQNEYNRYTPAADKIGHVLMTQTPSGIKMQQFAPPNLETNKTQWYPLKKIHIFEKNNAIQAHATLDDGTEMIARRSLDIKDSLSKDSQTLLLFSPKNQHGKDRPFANLEPIEAGNFTAPDKQKQQQSNISPRSVEKRQTLKRKPTQKKVMGQSAFQYMQHFYEQQQSTLSEAQKDYLSQRLLNHNAPFAEARKNHYYPEWMHAVAYSLSPIKSNPQTQDNISAGPQWANTAMMPIERMLKYFALHQHDTSQSVSTQFTHFADSNVVQSVDIQGTVSKNQRHIITQKKMQAWVKNPVFTRPTDVAQCAWLNYALLHNQPASIEETSSISAENKYSI